MNINFAIFNTQNSLPSKKYIFTFFSLCFLPLFVFTFTFLLLPHSSLSSFFSLFFSPFSHFSPVFFPTKRTKPHHGLLFSPPFSNLSSSSNSLGFLFTLSSPISSFFHLFTISPFFPVYLFSSPFSHLFH